MLRDIRLVLAVAALAIAAGFTPRLMAAQGPAPEAVAKGPGQPSASRVGDVANDVYIVEMSDAPVLQYAGGIPGLPATKPTRRRQKLDPNDANVAAYARYLDGRHDAALKRSGGQKLYGYRYSFNGFAARLTPSQAEALKSIPGVVRVTKDELRTGDRSSTPSLRGLD